MAPRPQHWTWLLLVIFRQMNGHNQPRSAQWLVLGEFYEFGGSYAEAEPGIW